MAKIQEGVYKKDPPIIIKVWIYYPLILKIFSLENKYWNNKWSGWKEISFAGWGHRRRLILKRSDRLFSLLCSKRIQKTVRHRQTYRSPYAFSSCHLRPRNSSTGGRHRQGAIQWKTLCRKEMFDFQGNWSWWSTPDWFLPVLHRSCGRERQRATVWSSFLRDEHFEKWNYWVSMFLLLFALGARFFLLWAASILHVWYNTHSRRR